MRAPAFAGRDAADHFGAVSDGLFGMKRPLTPGKALADHCGFLVDENRHAISLPSPL